MSQTQVDERQRQPRFGRRQLIASGMLGAAGLLVGGSSAAAAVDTSNWLDYTSPGPDGVHVRYPSTWAIDAGHGASLDPKLVYPYQSFAVRTAAEKPPIDSSGGGLPDLSGYPTDAAILWLMYYERVVEGPAFSGLSLSKLTSVPPDFGGFNSYVARFSNADRSFLLWARVGTKVDKNTLGQLDACLGTIAVP